jgi:hypothetical protein
VRPWRSWGSRHPPDLRLRCTGRIDEASFRARALFAPSRREKARADDDRFYVVSLSAATFVGQGDGRARAGCAMRSRTSRIRN